MLSIITPVHPTQKNFSTCLKALSALNPAPFEIIIILDGLTNLFDEILDCAKIKTIVLEESNGPAIARNHGAKLAKGDILCFVDSDVVVPVDFVKKVETEFSRDDTISAIFGSYDDQPAQPNFLSHYRNLLHHFVHQNSNENAFTFWSACGAIRKNIFWAANGFDGFKYPKPSVEDIELGTRLKKTGHSIKLCKDLQVKHLKKWTASSMIKTDLWHRALPWVQLILMNKNSPYDLNLKAKDRLSVVLVFLLIINIVLGFFLPTLGWGILLWILFFLTINYSVFQFFLKKRGWLFMLRTIPWKLIFYFISGLAFVIGTFSYIFLTKK